MRPPAHAKLDQQAIAELDAERQRHVAVMMPLPHTDPDALIAECCLHGSTVGGIMQAFAGREKAHAALHPH